MLITLFFFLEKKKKKKKINRAQNKRKRLEKIRSIKRIISSADFLILKEVIRGIKVDKMCVERYEMYMQKENRCIEAIFMWNTLID